MVFNDKTSKIALYCVKMYSQNGVHISRRSCGMELRHRVLIARREKHMSQEDLARAVGISVNTMARFERGEIKDIKATVLGKMAKVLGVSSDYLLGLQEEERERAGVGV
jgi:ribosome-binding protein aMBF1 (putative translation factor)